MSELVYDPREAVLDAPLAAFYLEHGFASRELVLADLQKLILENVNSSLAEVLMWLHEYQLHAGRDEWSQGIEQTINGSFMERKSSFWSYALPGCFDARSQLNWDASVAKDGPSLFVPRQAAASDALSLESFKGVFRGQRAFMIGGGPSLKKMNLAFLRDEITFGVNGILEQASALDYAPSLYTVGSLVEARRYAASIGKDAGSIKYFGRYHSSALDVDSTGSFCNIIYDLSRYPGYPHFSVDAAARTWAGESPVYQCLQWAYYMGFDEVCLIGFDHSFPGDPRTTLGAKSVSGGAVPGGALRPECFEQSLYVRNRFLADVESCFEKAKHAYRIAGKRIYNATPKSFLNVFEHRDIEDVLRTGSPALIDGELGVEWLAKKRDASKKSFSVHIRQDSQTPEISVIVPVYQVEPYTQRSLLSIMRQTYRNIEIIVVDDGSMDRSVEIARNMAKDDPRIRIVCQENQGLGPARNTGLKVASASRVMFVDSDDYLSPDACGSLLEKAKTDDLDIVNCLFYRITEAGRRDVYEPGFGFHDSPGDAARSILRGDCSPMAWGRLYRKELFTRNNLEYPPGWYEDKPVTVAAYMSASRVGTIESYCYYWLSRKDSISIRAFTAEHILGRFRALDLQKAFLERSPDRWEEYKEDFYLGVLDSFQKIMSRMLFVEPKSEREALNSYFYAQIEQRQLHLNPWLIRYFYNTRKND